MQQAVNRWKEQLAHHSDKQSGCSLRGQIIGWSGRKDQNKMSEEKFINKSQIGWKDNGLGIWAVWHESRVNKYKILSAFFILKRA